MTPDLVLRDFAGPIARLTLNDPARANVLSSAMMAALHEAIEAAAAAPQVRVVVLGAQGRIFCAGHDLSELRAMEDRAVHAALFERCAALMLAIRDCPRPVIARVQGAAVAAGCQLVAACDLAYAADTARFAVSGVNLGLFCSTPGVALGRAVGRKDAVEMLLTGRFVGAAEAQAMGLINRAVPVEGLDAAVDEIAQAIAAKAPEAIALGKRVFDAQSERDLESAYALAGSAMADNLALECARAGIDGFLAKTQ